MNTRWKSKQHPTNKMSEWSLNRHRDTLKRQKDHAFSATTSYSSPPMTHLANEAGGSGSGRKGENGNKKPWVTHRERSEKGGVRNRQERKMTVGDGEQA